MDGKQLVEHVRATVDSDPYVNYEIMDVAIIHYFNDRGVPVVALATRDGQHRIVMVNYQFFPAGPLANLHGDDARTKELFASEEARLREYELALGLARDFILRRSDEELLKLKSKWSAETLAANASASA